MQEYEDAEAVRREVKAFLKEAGFDVEGGSLKGVDAAQLFPDVLKKHLSTVAYGLVFCDVRPRMEAVSQLRTTYTYPVKGPTLDAGKFLHLSVLSNFTFWISPPFLFITVFQRVRYNTPAGFRD
jgi:hypothetical protein